jgi:hypothetical protein
MHPFFFFGAIFEGKHVTCVFPPLRHLMKQGFSCTVKASQAEGRRVLFEVSLTRKPKSSPPTYNKQLGIPAYPKGIDPDR